MTTTADHDQTEHAHPSLRETLSHQPKAVWVTAFAAVIAFMGIGLVDPILKPIADELGVGPSQVSLLFTSYMAVMGIAMLGTGWNSSSASSTVISSTSRMLWPLYRISSVSRL